MLRAPARAGLSGSAPFLPRPPPLTYPYGTVLSPPGILRSGWRLGLGIQLAFPAHTVCGAWLNTSFFSWRDGAVLLQRADDKRVLGVAVAKWRSHVMTRLLLDQARGGRAGPRRRAAEGGMCDGYEPGPRLQPGELKGASHAALEARLQRMQVRPAGPE